MISQEGAECANKVCRNFRLHHTRKCSNAKANVDLFKRCLTFGDMEIGKIMTENNEPKRKRKTTEPQPLPTLPTAAKPMIRNPEKFEFIGRYSIISIRETKKKLL